MVLFFFVCFCRHVPNSLYIFLQVLGLLCDFQTPIVESFFIKSAWC